jgi:hypothetical protein
MELNELQVFPNPVKSVAYFKGTGSIKSYSVFDMKGLKISETTLASAIPIPNLSIDVSALPSGIYLIQLINQLNQMFNETILR